MVQRIVPGIDSACLPLVRRLSARGLSVSSRVSVCLGSGHHRKPDRNAGKAAFHGFGLIL